MALQCLLHEDQCGCLVTSFGHKAFEYVAFVIHRAPQVVHLVINLHVDLIEMPEWVMPRIALPALPTEVPCEHRAWICGSSTPTISTAGPLPLWSDSAPLHTLV